MATSTTSTNALPGFIVDRQSIEQRQGRQVAWDLVSETYIDATTGKKRLKAGTVVSGFLPGDFEGKIAEYGAVDADQSPDETATALGLLISEANEDDPAEALTGYGILVGGVIFDNLLPDATGSPLSIGSTKKTALSTAGCTFKWEMYVDSRAD